MARNRKNGMAGVRLAPAAKAILLCILIGGSGVGYVLQKNKIYELGRQIAKREGVLERMRYQNKISADRLAALHMPDRLAERVKELRLGLVPPHPRQWIHLTEITRNATNGETALLVLGK
jgi:hypothetical protein